MKVTLTNQFIESTSSVYISDYERREKWNIDKVEIDGHHMRGFISLNLPKQVENNFFHLSFFTAMEFASQLQIIFMHQTANLSKKTNEAWMIESSFKTKNRITALKNILVTMEATKVRYLRDYLYCWATHQVSDGSGGLFEIKIKSVMKLSN